MEAAAKQTAAGSPEKLGHVAGTWLELTPQWITEGSCQPLVSDEKSLTLHP